MLEEFGQESNTIRLCFGSDGAAWDELKQREVGSRITMRRILSSFK